MASSYPGGIDSLTNPATSDSMAVVSHAGQHANANDAIEAIETELGTNPSGASASVKDRLDTLVVGPGSATDNALVRFDGTTGKLVQISGITVDDNGKVTTDLTVSKATPSVVVDAASAAQEAVVELQTGAVTRWKVGKNLAAESGSDAGSNFTIRAYSDAGALLSTPLTILRASAGATFSGKVTTTHSSGFEVGTSGPRVMSGTGSPEGVVTAPVGSQWIDTAATTGAVAWRKATGAGSSGWVVEYGDTGWRNVSASLDGTFLTANPNAVMHVRRVGKSVEFRFTAGSGGTFTTNYQVIYAIPSGFRPIEAAAGLANPTIDLVNAATPAASSNCLYLSGTSWRNGVGWVSGRVYMGQASIFTDDAWPSSLPGSAA